MACVTCLSRGQGTQQVSWYVGVGGRPEREHWNRRMRGGRAGGRAQGAQLA